MTSRERDIYQDEDGNWFNEENDPICARRRKTCDKKKGGCGHRYPKEEYDLLECPECGKDRYCRNVVDKPGYACKFHGGMSLKGAASPAFEHGGYSKYMPSDLAERYEEFREDPRRLSLDREIDLVRTLISDRVFALNSMNSAEAWKKAVRTYDQMMQAQARKEKDRFARLVLELGDILHEGEGLASTRKEVKEFIEQERKLVDTQFNLHIEMGEFMTRGMVLTMLGKILEAVTENVLSLPGGKQAANAIISSTRGMVGEHIRRQPREADQAIDSD